ILSSLASLLSFMMNDLQASQCSLSALSDAESRIILRRWCPLIGTSIQVVGLVNNDSDLTAPLQNQTQSQAAICTSAAIEYIHQGGRVVIDKNKVAYELIGLPMRSIGELWASLDLGSAEQQLKQPSDKFFDACSVSLSESWPRLAATMDDDVADCTTTADCAQSGDNLLNEVTQRLNSDTAAAKSAELVNEASTTESPTASPVITPPAAPLGSKMARKRARWQASRQEATIDLSSRTKSSSRRGGGSEERQDSRTRKKRHLASNETPTTPQPPTPQPLMAKRRESLRRQCQASASPLPIESSSALAALRRRYGFFAGPGRRSRQKSRRNTMPSRV
ncbi:hypothetical protein BOX15_Mlig009558g3, partial [Macrostomum lignano]